VLEVEDIRAGIAYLRERPDVDPDRLGIYGSSLGGAVAIMSGAELPELRAVVADASFASIQWVVDQQFSNLESAPKWLAPAIVALGGWQAGVDPGLMAPVDRVGRISPRPVMIIHGEEDATFLWQNAVLLGGAAQEPKEVWIDPGVGHERLYAHDPAGYAERVTAFFDRWL
jgi:dipeptidyl aminopeptidase/acylaminoacyl peptidase